MSLPNSQKTEFIIIIIYFKNRELQIQLVGWMRVCCIQLISSSRGGLFFQFMVKGHTTFSNYFNHLQIIKYEETTCLTLTLSNVLGLLPPKTDLLPISIIYYESLIISTLANICTYKEQFIYAVLVIKLDHSYMLLLAE